MIHIVQGVARRAAVVLLVVGAAAIPAAVVPGGIAAAAPLTSSAMQVHLRSESPAVVRANSRSLNWSGYVKSGSGFTSAFGWFKVPTLKTNYPGYSSTWVGLDGASGNDGYLIQTGIEADVVGGRAAYYGWWELITPSNAAPEVRFTSLAIHPGDSMTARVAKGSNGLWTMTLTDMTTKQAAAHTASFGGRGLSAEWIEEDTDVNGYISTAPDWQSVPFSGAAVNNANPGLVASEAIDIWSAPGLLSPSVHEDSTSAPLSTHNGFTVTWLATGRRSRA